MPDLGPSRCIIALVSVGDTSGLRFQCPSRCTEAQIYLEYTSGWANIGYFRCIASNRQNKIHRNSSIHSYPDVSKPSIHRKPKFSSNPDVFHLISRDSTCHLSQYTPAQVNLNLISRDSTCPLSKYTPQEELMSTDQKSKIAKIIRESNEPLTRKQIAGFLDISPSGITNNLNSLCKEGLVI